MSRGKNLRLSYTTWQELRRLKYRLGVSSYSEVLQRIFDSQERPVEPSIRVKPPMDVGDVPDRSDKTIVISPELHEKLHKLKTEFMLEKGLSSRGPSAISVSDILMELILQFKRKLE